MTTTMMMMTTITTIFDYNDDDGLSHSQSRSHLRQHHHHLKKLSSVVEFLVAMGLAWEWAALTGIAEYRGLTLALVPLHSSGITACVSHVFYNQIHVLVPLQALLTCLGNTTAAYAAWRIANHHQTTTTAAAVVETASTVAAAGAGAGAAGSTWTTAKEQVLVAESSQQSKQRSAVVSELVKADDAVSTSTSSSSITSSPTSSTSTSTISSSTTTLVGFEDMGEALRQDSNAFFLAKLFSGSALASYLVKYGGVLLWSLWQQREMHPNDDATAAELALVCIVVPSLLNAYKWYQRGIFSQEAE
jgi:Protein of unknown function (DUF2499)